MIDSQTAETEEKNIWKERFEFLSACHPQTRQLHRQLHAPDAFEQSWNVFDTVAKRTIGRGPTAGSAVDRAINS
jgi:hypothetical protein